MDKMRNAKKNKQMDKMRSGQNAQLTKEMQPIIEVSNAQPKSDKQTQPNSEALRGERLLRFRCTFLVVVASHLEKHGEMNVEWLCKAPQHTALDSTLPRRLSLLRLPPFYRFASHCSAFGRRLRPLHPIPPKSLIFPLIVQFSSSTRSLGALFWARLFF